MSSASTSPGILPSTTSVSFALGDHVWVVRQRLPHDYPVPRERPGRVRDDACGPRVAVYHYRRVAEPRDHWHQAGADGRYLGEDREEEGVLPDLLRGLLDDAPVGADVPRERRVVDLQPPDEEPASSETLIPYSSIFLATSSLTFWPSNCSLTFDHTFFFSLGCLGQGAEP